MRVLFLSRWFPYPSDNGAKIRVFNLIQSLAARHAVHLVSFASEPVSEARLAAMRRHCQEVGTVVYRGFQPTSWRAVRGFFSPRPRSVEDTFSLEMQARIANAVRASAFDVVIASEIDMAVYALGLPIRVKIFEELELTTIYEQYLRAHRLAHKLRSGLTWWKLSSYTAKLLRQFHGCTVVSEIERERLWQVSSGYQPVAIVPNGVDVMNYQPGLRPPQPNTLIYSGALTYSANFDAVDYFLREIYPHILAEVPEVKFYITGKLDGVPVDRLPRHPGVIFTGYLDDIRPALAGSWVSVAPLRLGGGTRLKILEAMALGVPVIATPKGSEGLAVTPGRDLLIADDPIEFAAQTIRLLRDPVLRQRLSQQGRQVVEGQYDWTAICQRFNQFVEQVAAQRSPALAETV